MGLWTVVITRTFRVTVRLTVYPTQTILFIPLRIIHTSISASYRQVAKPFRSCTIPSQRIIMRVPRRDDRSLLCSLNVTSGSTLRVSPSAVVGTWRSMIHASSFHTSDGNRSVHDRSSLTCRSPFVLPWVNEIGICLECLRWGCPHPRVRAAQAASLKLLPVKFCNRD